MVLSAIGRCPYSANLVDQGEHEGLPYIVEELMQSSLADVIQKSKLGVDQVVALGLELLEGIDYFHRLGQTNIQASQRLGLEALTHCDIKPSNILQGIDPLTARVVRKYTDFGIRKQEGPVGKPVFVNSVSSSSLRQGAQTSTRNIFASPEVREALLMGEAAPATVQGDLWSIGAVLFYAATGRAPTWGETVPMMEGECVPAPLASFFLRILSGKLEERYASARLAHDDLESSLQYDDLVMGLATGLRKNYSLFAQRMKVGVPIGAPRRKDLDGDPSVVPRIAYVPGMKMIVAIAPNAGKYQAILYDSALEEIKRVEIGEDEKGPVFFSDVEMVRHTSDRRVALRIQSSLGKSVLYLPRMSSYHDNRHYKSTAPGSFFGEWRKMEPSMVSLDRLHKIDITDNTIRIFRTSDGAYCRDLDVPNVFSAVWVPK